MNNNLSLLKIIGGLNKSLSIARQVVPLYKQVKPILSNSAAFLSKFTANSTSSNTSSNIKNSNKTNSNVEKSMEQPTIKSSGSNPVFFQ